MERGLKCASQSLTASSTFCFPVRTNNLSPSSARIAGVGAKPRRRPISVGALKSTGSSPRRTLSSHWDVSARHPSAAITPSLSRLPSVEELDTTNMLLRQRIVYLGSQIESVTADFIISQLLFLDAEDSTKDIKFFIHSSGGSSIDAMGIYDAMKLCKADVSTICVGMAGSVSTFLLAAGTKGKRFCLPNAKIMIHLLPGYFDEDSYAATQIRELNYCNTKIAKIMSRLTGKTQKQIHVDAWQDKYMSPWEAKEYGLIDEVIDDGKPGLIAPSAEPLPPPKAVFAGPWTSRGISPEDVPSENKLLQNGSVRSHTEEKDGEVGAKAQVPPSQTNRGVEEEPEVPPSQTNRGVEEEPEVPPSQTNRGVEEEPEVPPSQMNRGVEEEPEVPPSQTNRGVEEEPEVPPSQMNRGVEEEPEVPPSQTNRGVEEEPEVPPSA